MGVDSVFVVMGVESITSLEKEDYAKVIDAKGCSNSEGCDRWQ